MEAKLKGRTKILWYVWGGLTLLAVAVLFWGLSFERLSDAASPLRAQVRGWFSPAALTPGHAQISLQCTACHADRPFAAQVENQACMDCHPRNDDSKQENTHPLAKFRDLTNAHLLEKLAADQCVTCHQEHQPGAKAHDGVTVPVDFCVACHQDVAKDTPSHETLGFETCTSTGCHSYHDNRATYRRLLKRHAGKGPPEAPQLPGRDFALRAAEFGVLENPHRPGADPASVGVCKDCHGLEAASFAAGKHGMREAAGLAPMSPGRAQEAGQRFRPDAHSKTLSCTRCHDAAVPDVKRAAVEACMSCHDDPHTRAYPASPHARLWEQELRGELPAGSGVSCATCHMPRVEQMTPEGEVRVLVSHDNTGNLRPVIKQAKVCLTCHTLQFTHDALADRELANAANFKGKPSVHVRSIEMEAARKK